MSAPVHPPVEERAALVRRGLVLNALTMAYNVLEAIVSLIAGFVAGSVALVGFGADSLIEVSSSVAALWRLPSDADLHRRAHVEKTTLRIVGWCFTALAVYVAGDSVKTLWLREVPDVSDVGMVITALSVVVMPLLARAKRRVGWRSLSNRQFLPRIVQRRSHATCELSHSQAGLDMHCSPREKNRVAQDVNSRPPSRSFAVNPGASNGIHEACAPAPREEFATMDHLYSQSELRTRLKITGSSTQDTRAPNDANDDDSRSQVMQSSRCRAE
jgi:hypothetical protein